MTTSLGELDRTLATLEVDPAVVLGDPTGRSWLTERDRALVDGCDACRQRFAEFVQTERALRRDADVGVDPLFTARVLTDLPPPLLGTGVRPARRVMLLAGFHIAAAAAAYAVIWFLAPAATGPAASLAEAVGALDPTHAVALTVAAVAVAAALALLPAKSHTSPT